MRYWSCESEVHLSRKVKVRPWRELVTQAGDAFDSAAYAFYVKEMTYRWAFICQACYAQLDNEDGRAQIGAREFNLAGASRWDRAPVVDEPKHQAFERRQAAKMGLAL